MKYLRLCLSLVFAFSFTALSVYAYLDPGTGSLLLQFLMGLMLGFLFYFKQIGRGILTFFKNKDT